MARTFGRPEAVARYGETCAALRHRVVIPAAQRAFASHQLPGISEGEKIEA